MFSTEELPFPPPHESAEAYVSSILSFSTQSEMLQTLCGGVHVLDFLVREPDLYRTVLPADWCDWLSSVDVMDFVDLLVREDVGGLLQQTTIPTGGGGDAAVMLKWRNYSMPPKTLLEYINSVRELLLDRAFQPPNGTNPPPLSRQISIGMSAKKSHEVTNFASFICSSDSSLYEATSHRITHLVDFGSGQNYLGRVLAGPAYEKSLIALESKADNIKGAERMDMLAKLRKKEVVLRNKKEWRVNGVEWAGKARKEEKKWEGRGDVHVEYEKTSGTVEADSVQGRINYVEHRILDGDLGDVSCRARELLNERSKEIGTSQDTHRTCDPELMVISLHSCGNLVHHGLRSLILNPSVKVVAMVGCCYNLCTERLGPPSYKLPNLRSRNERVASASLTRDPHGFPMSDRFVTYKHKKGTGVRFNITARMMAVQAPQNWTGSDCESFFTRHFYRALLQRIFLDQGFVNPPVAGDDVVGGSVRGWAGGTEPITLGSLPKAAYKNFVAYVRAAFAKIKAEEERGRFLEECMKDLSDTDIAAYEQRFQHKKHEICVLWSLMCYSAGVVECAMVADRWLYLKEQNQVSRAWVQAVFDYGQSPRNLVVVGIKG